MITYLLGAGASADALPIVNNIPTKISEVIKAIQKLDSNLLNGPLFQRGPDANLTKQNLITDLEWLRDSSANHSSIDTFAKKLFLKKEIDSLHRLKVSLAIFLSLCEILNIKDDLRYDSFIASICKDDLSFPKNIRVLSWNYDTQFERSFSQFSNECDVSNILPVLNVGIKGNFDSFNSDQFGIIKLNGTALIKNKRKYIDHTPEICRGLNTGVMMNFLKSYAYQNLFKSDYEPGISFAWENMQMLDPILTKDHNESIVLVIIGYSFPFFNREIDRMIINRMHGKLQYVYYQTVEDRESARQRLNVMFESWGKKPIIEVSNNCSQFYLPPQL